MGEIGFSSGEFRLRLIDAAFGVDSGLIGFQVGLRELFIEHGDLVLRRAELGFRLGDGGASLIFAFADLLIIKNGDGVSGFHGVAFAEADLHDAAAGFGGERGIVTFDAATESDDAIG